MVDKKENKMGFENLRLLTSIAFFLLVISLTCYLSLEVYVGKDIVYLILPLGMFISTIGFFIINFLEIEWRRK